MHPDLLLVIAPFLFADSMRPAITRSDEPPEDAAAGHCIAALRTPAQLSTYALVCHT